MAEQSLELELLMQLFFVFEGISFWKLAKLPKDLKMTPMEDEELYRKVYEIGSENEVYAYTMMVLNCQKINNRFRISDMLVNKIDNLYSFVIVPPFIIIVWFFCLKFPAITPICKITLYAAALVYMVAKCIIYYIGKHYRQKFIKMLNKFQVVPAPENQGTFTKTSDNTD